MTHELVRLRKEAEAAEQQLSEKGAEMVDTVKDWLEGRYRAAAAAQSEEGPCTSSTEPEKEKVTKCSLCCESNIAEGSIASIPCGHVVII
jgi:hypothetical protein